MEQHIADDSMAIQYSPKFREYGILYLDGGSSFQIINYCPWCGNRLPESLRSEWFEKIEEMGMEPDDPEIPKELLSDEWWI